MSTQSLKKEEICNIVCEMFVLNVLIIAEMASRIMEFFLDMMFSASL